MERLLFLILPFQNREKDTQWSVSFSWQGPVSFWNQETGIIHFLFVSRSFCKFYSDGCSCSSDGSSLVVTGCDRRQLCRHEPAYFVSPLFCSLLAWLPFFHHKSTALLLTVKGL
ncbi:hypothetical protein CDAR_236831 [Caerostris darwini]|uniref:Uncharacterized protein n=1 Tax=Caerostris darwini TaxID=1538125 RepID=A0AAV4S1Y8_9ARAC|nr:hypothetical protein CDAR_236831 [Caerostris darwini]